MSTSVLLTGAYGNIGYNCLKFLLEAGHQVTTLDMENPNNTARAAEFGTRIKTAWGDICDEATVSNALAGVDVVIHLAAIFPPLSETNRELAQRVNVDGTNLLIRLMEASATAKRLVFASSMAVYGDQQQTRTPPLTVSGEYAPHNVYATTKVANEKAVKQSSLNWSILRISACPPVSTRSGGDPHVMFKISSKARIEYIHPSDAGLAFANTAACDEAIEKILLIGGGKNCQVTGLEFVSTMLTAMGVGAIPAEALNPEPTFDGDWLDTEESQRLLQFQRHSLQDFGKELRKEAGWRYWMVRLMAPLARTKLLARSPYWKS